jgi:5-methylthioadenosine/S-adenosylhomocysteine deaminase
MAAGATTWHKKANSPMQLLRAAYLIGDPELLEASVIRDGAVVFDKGVVVAVGAWQDLEPTYRGITPLDIPYHSLIIPGLINAHHHGRGLATTQIGMVDKPLELWLPSFILYPPLDPYLDTLYTAARMLKSGVTTSLLSHSDSGPIEGYRQRTYRSIKAYQAAGVRIAFALGYYDQHFLTHVSEEEFFATLPAKLASQARRYFDPKNLYISAEDYFDFFGELHQEFQSDSKVRMLLSPCGFHWASSELQKCMTQASEHYQTNVHLHALETPYQREYAKRVFGKATTQVLSENGLLGPHVSLAHGIHVTSEDIALLSQTNTMIVTNPSSNLRLGSGTLPLHDLLASNVRVALGMDSMSLCADDDMLSELALLQALHRRYDGKQLSPYQALEMATGHGAQVTGFSGLGKLLPTHQADVVVLDLQRFSTPLIYPEVDLVALALSQGKATDVHSVFVAGERLVKNGDLVKLELYKLTVSIQKHLELLMDRLERDTKVDFLRALEPYLAATYEKTYTSA